MSIDWIALGSVVAALPIVLLLCFTGCVLDTKGLLKEHPALILPPNLGLHVLWMDVTMKIEAVDDSQGPVTIHKTALEFPPNGGTLTFDEIDPSTVNTDPSSFGEGVSGPYLTLICKCGFFLEGSDPNKPPITLQVPHQADDSDSLDVVFTLSVTGTGTSPSDYSLA